eukprot:5635494-Amphidinium_carterae.1
MQDFMDAMDTDGNGCNDVRANNAVASWGVCLRCGGTSNTQSFWQLPWTKNIMRRRRFRRIAPCYLCRTSTDMRVHTHMMV